LTRAAADMYDDSCRTDKKGMCMIGGIYSDQRCPQCGSKFRDGGRKGLFCPKHPRQAASRFRVKFLGLCKRFSSYDEAQRFLVGVRFQFDTGTFDPRDWQRDQPLGFSSLAEQWLERKKNKVKKKSFNNLKSYMGKAASEWGARNIKSIGTAQIEDFLDTQAKVLSKKTVANMCSCLHDFWNWISRREVIEPHRVPHFPSISFELGFRRTVDKGEQQRVLDEIHRLTFDLNPKIWLGVKFLCTYISIRPGEMIRIKEENINLEQGFIFIPHPKEKRPKLVPLRAEDVDLIKALPRGFPHLPFFRHVPGISGCQAGQPFGEKYFYKWWKRACANLGIEGVDLYGGTRHSSARALGKYRTPEEIRRATMHSTNKAFERYFQMEADDLRAIYDDTQVQPADTRLTPEKGGSRKAKVLKLQ